MASSNGRRVAIVAGLRTPFVKSGGPFGDLTAQELGRAVVAELLQRAEVKPELVDEVIYGSVIPSISGPNIAREIVLTTGMKKETPAHSVSFACATAIKAMTEAAEGILLGRTEVAVAGGAECLSDIPILYSRRFSNALVASSKARDIPGKLKAFRGIKGKDLLPVPPALAEATTGLSMGESCEKMARENGISREAQDKFAYESHQKAAAAWDAGKFDREVMHLPVPPKYEETVAQDNIVRKDTTIEALAKLRPVFDRKYGTLTAGNSSPLTDGASALLLMSEEKARALGYTPLGFLKSYGYAAIDPGWQLLMAPVWAAPKALKSAGLELGDMDLVDMHEAFAAQVLSNLQALASKKFCEERLGLSEAVGEVAPERLNVNGGSISLGHPFAATGGRMVLSALNELGRRNKQHALLTLCAAGGLGAAVVLERN